MVWRRSSQRRTFEPGASSATNNHHQPAGKPRLRQHSNIMDSRHVAATELNSAQQEPWSLPTKKHQQPQPGHKETATQNTIAKDKKKTRDGSIPGDSFGRKKSWRRIIYVYKCKAARVQQVSISSVASSAREAYRLTGYPSFWVILHIQESRNKGSLCRVVVCWIMVSTRCLNAKPKRRR